jgi:hypothetical protein
MVWLRTSGAKLLAVDARSGEVLREVHIDPAPFGLTWHVERHGGVFVVRDDHEIAAYDDPTGARLWKRTSPTNLAIAGETEDGTYVSVAPGGYGIEIFETDLRVGSFERRARMPGSMRWIGANGVLTEDMLFFATDEHEVFAVDRAWRVSQRHALFGSAVLPPVATSLGVHVAVVERRARGAITTVATLDRRTAAIVSTHALPGVAYAMSAGANGLVVDVRRSKTGALERVAFRPESPQLRLVAARHVALGVMRDLDSPPGTEPPPSPVEILPAERTRPRGDREELIPPPRDASTRREGSPGDGFRALTATLDARSDVLARIADAFEDGSGGIAALAPLGLTIRDPRVRWTARLGRDPCLVDLAQDGAGDAIATYLYPPGASGHVPVVCAPSDGPATWLGDDFDAWFAGYLADARRRAPDLVAVALDALGLPASFPHEHPAAVPPRWFFEAHGAAFTMDDASAALVAGDAEGAERMLVSAAMRGAAAEAKVKLAALYEQLGWTHARTVVLEAW